MRSILRNKRAHKITLFPKGKKGFELLTKQVLELVIALLCIAALVYFITRLFFGAVQQNEQNAREIVLGDNGLIREIERIRDGGDVNEQGFFISNPNDWYVFGFAGEELIKTPNLCAGQRCICICQKVVFNIGDNQLKKCDLNAACGIVENLKEFAPIKIESSGIYLAIEQKSIGGLIEVSKK